jgi:hypothetical protein
VRDDVTISYRGARYEIGRGQHYYGIWPAGAPHSQPVEWWPQTPEGWYGAWSRFAGIETPGTIVQVSPSAATPASAEAVPLVAVPRTRALVAAALLAVGVAVGIAGLFPDYFTGASLAQESAELVPHAIYLATWTASAVLILLGGTRLRAGVLLGLGTSIVTFGLFVADLGTAISGPANLVGAGLVLSLVSWLACAAGSATAFGLRSAGAPGAPRRGQKTRIAALTVATLAGLGTAIAFAPSWDHYTLHTAAGGSGSQTAGNAFANPALVITGDVIVMVALVAVVVAAAMWRPVRGGAALLAGAAIVMVAQAVSALILLSQPVSPELFGISPAQAAQAGLTISSGGTAVFWIYFAFLIALVAICAWMLLSSRPAAQTAATPVAGAAIPPTAQAPTAQPMTAQPPTVQPMTALPTQPITPLGAQSATQPIAPQTSPPPAAGPLAGGTVGQPAAPPGAPPAVPPATSTFG